MSLGFTAIIPVKAKSSRLPGKNTLPFGKGNLLTHKINQLKDTPSISEILVTSDSDEMLQMASNEGVRTDKRPPDMADESRPLGDLVRYLIDNYLSTEHLMWTPVTSPTLDSEFYSDAISKYLDALNNGYDSLTTTTKFQHFLMDEAGPFNFAPFEEKPITNSTDLSPMDLWTCGCSIISVKLAYEKYFIFGTAPYRYSVTPYQALDIDTEFDYEVTRAMWERYGEK